MAIKSIEEIMKSLNGIIGEHASDDALALIEDISDTFADKDSKAKDTTDWEKKYNDNDKMWRDKYRARFFTKGDDSEEEEPTGDKPLTYESLFKED